MGLGACCDSCSDLVEVQVLHDVLCMFFSVMTTVAMAGLWEIVEWLYAAIDGGKAGAAFLGSQGDKWDAQKDILCDTLAALCASVLFLISSGRNEGIRFHARGAVMVVGIVFALPYWRD